MGSPEPGVDPPILPADATTPSLGRPAARHRGCRVRRRRGAAHTALIRASAILLALALLVAGCGREDQGITGGGRVIGETLTVASLMPVSGTQQFAAQDIVDGQKLAIARAGGRAGAYKVNFISVDAGAADAVERPGAVAEASRQVLTDSQVIAVIGPLDSAAVMTALPLLNAAGLLQVSPGASYRGFTDANATPGEPERFLPSGRRTFARVAGDDRALAAAMARAAGRARRVAVEADPGPIARSAERVIAGDDAARASGPEGLGAAAGRVRFVVPTAPTDRAFAAEFQRAFGRAPSPWAGLGHEAMRRVLETIRAAGSRAADRGHVAERYLATRWPAGGFTVRRPAADG